MFQPFITPVFSRFISARLYSVPQVEIEAKRLHFVDVAEIQEAVTNELKKAQKEEFSAAFQKLHDLTKDYICQLSLF
jgi:FMN-dependent NADH-azoreductase